MGEDRTMCSEKKPNEVCRHRHSSVMSSCSEDAGSESTSAGYPPSSPDEEREEELEYGPGIVNKLRTRFLSITLKQNRGMRRSCSMENLLDQDRPKTTVDKTDSAPARPSSWGNLKRAKSMDTLLLEMNPELVKGGHNRLCDEELPKPDTVKTYKRMFEPAESRRGSHGRRPPVLRASAKSSSASKLVGSSAKVNGTSSKSKISAKQNQAQSPDRVSPVKNGGGRKLMVNGDRPLYNGCHVVKATPVKINRGKEVDSLNSINRLLNKKEVHFAAKTDIICNGTHKEVLKTKEEMVTQFSKVPNGKPKVPPNRPSLRSPAPTMKTSEQRADVITPTKPKPVFANGLKKPFGGGDRKIEPKSPELKSPPPYSKDTSSKIPRETQSKGDLKSPSPEVKPNNIWTRDRRLRSPVLSPVSDEATTRLKPEHNNESILTPEKKIKDKPEPTNQLIGPPETDKHTKVNKRTAPLSPTLNNLDKSLKEPVTPPSNLSQVKLTNGSVEPAKKVVSGCAELTNKPTNGYVDPARKPTNGSLDPVVKKPVVSAMHKPNVSSVPHPSVPEKNLVEPVKQVVNGLTEPVKKAVNGTTEPKTVNGSSEPVDVKRPIKKSPAQATSMVFDFRGKDVVSHVAVLPVPFGCKALHPKKRVDGKDTADEDEDEDYVDYSVPPPSGVIFEGENVKIGKGSILAIRNKDLKIKFDDAVDGNTFVYPSETSLLEEPEKSTSPKEVIPNGQPPPHNSKLKTNTSIGSSSAGGLSNYTPSLLRTLDTFEPGMFRTTPSPEDKQQPDPHSSQENEGPDGVPEEDKDLKPADPDITSAWSVSAGTSDLLF